MRPKQTSLPLEMGLMRLRTRNEFEYAEQGFSDAGLRIRSLFLRIRWFPRLATAKQIAKNVQDRATK
ncbi:MAG TPA: hypothetical protein DEQ25_09000 [Methylophaga sp.]|nr:hypothetical protein [Methylophaga sp.]MAP26293.1 hypothetical protein [Methylophaga sp.]MBP24682.1 hypothetical protein [Methylophaga sp.]HAD31729.1 hypothetical protein [Methylophaga sp.]HBX60872.1 hypothetical protein [Methylophaga sp.]